MSGSADKIIKFYDFIIVNNQLNIKLTHQLLMSSDILVSKYSYHQNADKLMIAIGLLDNTIKIFYDDSLKFFLSLYGHKLPVLSLDFSTDNKLIVTGSVDKTIKIWLVSLILYSLNIIE